MSVTVTRHFVSIEGRWGSRQVHYRRAGHGPAVLLLHQSPQSSREMVELMQQWGRDFTVIAPDTPGYGQSDPLGPPLLDMAAFAEALREFADAIGLRRFGIHGYHTGSSIGLWLASAHPQRVTALACNGLACLTDAERADVLSHYLLPLVPSWDGSHLAWLWARVREQRIFYPWHERSAAARLPVDMAPPEQLHFGVMEFLRAGDHYAIAYRAAFDSRPAPHVATLRVPLLVTATPRDPLRVHLQRLGPLPPLAETVGSDSPAAAAARCLQFLLGHPGDVAPPPVATRPLGGRLWNTMVNGTDGQVRVQLDTSGAGEPLMLLHGAGGSGDTTRHLVSRLLGHRPVVVPDLPGHGESDPPAGGRGPSIAQAAAAALQVLHALGLNEVVLAGQGAGAWVAAESSRRGTLRRRRLAMIDPPYVDAGLRDAFLAQGLPSLAPQWHGGHLLLAWHLLRDGRLYFPWFARTATAVRHGEPDLDPVRLHLELRELLKAEGAWQCLLADALAYPGTSAPGTLPEGLLGAAASSAWASCTRAAGAAHPALACVDLPEQPADWLPTLLAQWD